MDSINAVTVNSTDIIGYNTNTNNNNNNINTIYYNAKNKINDNSNGGGRGNDNGNGKKTTPPTPPTTPPTTNTLPTINISPTSNNNPPLPPAFTPNTNFPQTSPPTYNNNHPPTNTPPTTNLPPTTNFPQTSPHLPPTSTFPRTNNSTKQSWRNYGRHLFSSGQQKLSQIASNVTQKVRNKASNLSQKVKNKAFNYMINIKPNDHDKETMVNVEKSILLHIEYQKYIEDQYNLIKQKINMDILKGKLQAGYLINKFEYYLRDIDELKVFLDVIKKKYSYTSSITNNKLISTFKFYRNMIEKIDSNINNHNDWMKTTGTNILIFLKKFWKDGIGKGTDDEKRKHIELEYFSDHLKTFNKRWIQQKELLQLLESRIPKSNPENIQEYTQETQVGGAHAASNPVANPVNAQSQLVLQELNIEELQKEYEKAYEESIKTHKQYMQAVENLKQAEITYNDISSNKDQITKEGKQLTEDRKKLTPDNPLTTQLYETKLQQIAEKQDTLAKVKTQLTTATENEKNEEAKNFLEKIKKEKDELEAKHKEEYAAETAALEAKHAKRQEEDARLEEQYNNSEEAQNHAAYQARYIPKALHTYIQSNFVKGSGAAKLLLEICEYMKNMFVWLEQIKLNSKNRENDSIYKELINNFEQRLLEYKTWYSKNITKSIMNNTKKKQNSIDMKKQSNITNMKELTDIKHKIHDYGNWMFTTRQQIKELIRKNINSDEHIELIKLLNETLIEYAEDNSEYMDTRYQMMRSKLTELKNNVGQLTIKTIKTRKGENKQIIQNSSRLRTIVKYIMSTIDKEKMSENRYMEEIGNNYRINKNAIL